MYKAQNCVRCGKEISKARLEALPETRTCVACSVERPKTDMDVEISLADPADLRKDVTNY